MRKLFLLLMVVTLNLPALANFMRFGRTDSPGAFRVNLPGAWVRGHVDGCFEDVLGSRLQAIIAANPDRTVDNTFPNWKKSREDQGYKVQAVKLGGTPALIARGPDNVLGVVLREGYQINLMLNVSSDQVNVDELVEQLVKTFQWLNP